MHRVVVNDEGQYSTWPADRELPEGWQPTGFQSGKEECLSHIEEVWTDLRPKSVRGPAATNTIRTARLLLRELTAAQVAVLLDETARSDQWVPGYPLPGSKNAATGFGRRTAGQLRHGFGMYHLVRGSDGLVIGEMGFHQPPDGGSVEVGFGLAESCRGEGYATEALTGLVRWAFTQPGVDRVVARTLSSNGSAQGVLARTGFVYVAHDGEFEHYVLAAPPAEPFEADDEGRAAVAAVTEARLPGGIPHELVFVPGSEPLLRLIRQNGRVLAFVQCGTLEGVDDEDNHFLHIVVRPDAARRGLATRLLAEARGFARDQGRTGLVAATADEDVISGGWVRKHGFEVIGLHGVSRRAPGTAPGTATGTATGTETGDATAAGTGEVPGGPAVEPVDRADARAVEELVALGMKTFAETVLPGGVKLDPDPETVRQVLIGDGDGLLLICRQDGRAVGWLASDPVREGNTNLLDTQALAGCARADVSAALLAALTRWADREQVTVTAIVEEKGRPEFAAALPRFGFDRISGRTIWRLAVVAAAPRSTSGASRSAE